MSHFPDLRNNFGKKSSKFPNEKYTISIAQETFLSDNLKTLKQMFKYSIRVGETCLLWRNKTYQNDGYRIRFSNCRRLKINITSKTERVDLYISSVFLYNILTLYSFIICLLMWITFSCFIPFKRCRFTNLRTFEADFFQSFSCTDRSFVHTNLILKSKLEEQQWAYIK